MQDTEQFDDALVLLRALRAYAVKYRRAYGRSRAARHLGVPPVALWHFTNVNRRPDVGVAVLRRLGTDDVSEIRRRTAGLPGWRRVRG